MIKFSLKLLLWMALENCGFNSNFIRGLWKGWGLQIYALNNLGLLERGILITGV